MIPPKKNFIARTRMLPFGLPPPTALRLGLAAAFLRGAFGLAAFGALPAVNNDRHPPVFNFGFLAFALLRAWAFASALACASAVSRAFCSAILRLVAAGDILAAKDDATEEKTDAFSFLDVNALFGATKVRRFPFCAITARA